MTDDTVRDPTEGSAGLPDVLVHLLDGTDLASKVGHTVLLVVNDVEGWPHMALLSVGEVLATAPDQVGLALYATSGTSRALRDQSRALLFTVVEQRAYKVRLLLRETVEPSGGQRLVYFLATVVEARRDSVGYATVLDGVRYALYEPNGVLPRWAATLGELARLSSRASD